MNLPFRKSRLKKAIERGLANGKIRDELRELGDLTLKSRADGEDLCWALDQLATDSTGLSEKTYDLSRLFQNVDGRDCHAFEILEERGIPKLLELFDRIQQTGADDDTNALMFLLKIFAMYGTTAGALKIIEAARQPLKPDGYMWNVILEHFTSGHPEKDLLFNSLKDPLPVGFIAVSLLDAANHALIEGDSMPHPFDSATGKERLQSWLVNRDAEEFSYAQGATTSLPFVSNPERDCLLELAMNHPDTGVQMQAAWAAAKVGRADGIDRLAKHCLDFTTSERAKRLLSDLGRENAIPAQANNPDFAATAQFSQWLAHPNELGRAPDDLEIVDQRELRWPPKDETKPFWLIKYRVRDTTGLEDDDVQCGLVGSITFCLFSYKLAQRPPEDCYAIHCCWEAEGRKLIEETDVRGEAGEYDNLLNQWSGPQLQNPQISFVAELSPELKHPQRLVGLASATLDGEPGWVVLDGNRSEWYPKREQPEEDSGRVILKIHIGRQLLGFSDKPQRKKFIAAAPVPRPAEQIIAGYEKLLAKAEVGDEENRKRAFGHYGPIWKHFEQYINALLMRGRGTEICNVIERMLPRWDDPHGHEKLGKAAFVCGELKIAREYLEKSLSDGATLERSETAGILAEVWCRTDNQDAARKLLLDCMRQLIEDSKTATGSDIGFFEKRFQMQRNAFLKLFPGEESLLAAEQIPASTLRGH